MPISFYTGRRLADGRMKPDLHLPGETHEAMQGAFIGPQLDKLRHYYEEDFEYAVSDLDGLMQEVASAAQRAKDAVVRAFLRELHLVIEDAKARQTQIRVVHD